MAGKMGAMRFLTKSGPSISSPSFKFISTFVHLRQEPKLAEAEPPPPPQSPMPPNPASGSPLYKDNWRSSDYPSSFGFHLNATSQFPLQPMSPMLDAKGLMNQFAELMTSQRWPDVKQRFEVWIKSLDASGKLNKPDVNLYNQYLRANLMMGASAGDLLDLVVQMEDYEVLPNTASFNLVLKAMLQAGESVAAEKLIERMLQAGEKYKDALPDDESYDLVIKVLLSRDQVDRAQKYIDMTLKSGYMLSVNSFLGCALSCVKHGRLDYLVSVIEGCKKMDQNKSLCPPWTACNYIADTAMQSDNSDLTYYALEFMARCIARGEMAKPPVYYSADEGLIISALGTAGRTSNSKLLDGSWAILKRSLRQKVPSPESYLAKIFAHANSGNLQKAFSTLHEFETTHGNSTVGDGEGLFSPFYSLNPLVLACCKKGFKTLDMVYLQLENLSRVDNPYKSIAALNCIILGCANIWDVDRAYETFSSINRTFGLTPNIHSYNSLICAFGKLSKRDEAVKVFEHFIGLGVSPNLTTYSLLVDAHLTKRDPKAALAVIDDMISAGWEPPREMLKKVRRRCMRELDYESDDKVESLAKQFQIRMNRENRRDLLFNLEYATYALEEGFLNQ